MDRDRKKTKKEIQDEQAKRELREHLQEMEETRKKKQAVLKERLGNVQLEADSDYPAELQGHVDDAVQAMEEDGPEGFFEWLDDAEEQDVNVYNTLTDSNSFMSDIADAFTEWLETKDANPTADLAMVHEEWPELHDLILNDPALKEAVVRVLRGDDVGDENEELDSQSDSQGGGARSAKPRRSSKRRSSKRRRRSSKRRRRSSKRRRRSSKRRSTRRRRRRSSKRSPTHRRRSTRRRSSKRRRSSRRRSSRRRSSRRRSLKRRSTRRRRSLSRPRSSRRRRSSKRR